MNIPQKAVEAGTEAIVYDGRGSREARKDAQAVLEAVMPFIAAQVLREIADEIREDDPVAHAYAKFLSGRADEIDPQ